MPEGTRKVHFPGERSCTMIAGSNARSIRLDLDRGTPERFVLIAVSPSLVVVCGVSWRGFVASCHRATIEK